MELFLNGDLIDTVDDRKILLHLPLRDKTLLTGKLSPTAASGGGGIPVSFSVSFCGDFETAPELKKCTGVTYYISFL